MGGVGRIVLFWCFFLFSRSSAFPSNKVRLAFNACRYLLPLSLWGSNCYRRRERHQYFWAGCVFCYCPGGQRCFFHHRYYGRYSLAVSTLKPLSEFKWQQGLPTPHSCPLPRPLSISRPHHRPDRLVAPRSTTVSLLADLFFCFPNGDTRRIVPKNKTIIYKRK